ncbi:DUF6493 family protein [Chryseobacterium sp. Mn2064]|uniref:DUF6493 family protein n=1 Tax=Chryseobacterium sp. Mn2064 TaxID=3395263 RepID=UPI003BED1658
MLIEDEFKTLYLNYRIKEIVPFLKKLKPKDKKEVVALLKKHIHKEWGHNTISLLAALACCKTKNEFERLAPGYFSIPVEAVEDLFESYQPDWLGESYPFLREFNYLKVLEWEQKGFLQLNDESIALLLATSIFSNDNSDEIVFTFPVTLTSHIWFLFQYESDITAHYGERDWKKVLKGLVESKAIDRSRLLQESLKAVNLNVSKEHNAWFLELFAYLEPTDKEIVELQDELLMIFHSTQHSLFLGILKMINQIITDSAFKTEDFLYAATSLITLPTKNIVNALLVTVEKMAKNNPQYQEEICLLVLPVFLNKDKALQIKGAKIIARYGNPESEKIQQHLFLYRESLLSDTKLLLEKFFIEKNESEIIEEDVYQKTSWYISESIASVETIDDFIFLASQIFNNNKTYHFDQFLEAIIRFNSELKKEHFNQLEPAFNAALKLKETKGLHHLLATFFIHYGLLKQEKKSQVLLTAGSEFPLLENWSEEKTPFILKAYHQLLLDILELLKQNKNLPLLCVPDCTPCWITVHHLVDKLRIYQQQNEDPISMDWQIAVLRVKKEKLDEAEKYAKEKLNKKYFELLNPVFDQDYFRERYENVYLEGNFKWEFSDRKIYRWNGSEEIPQLLISLENKSEIPVNATFLDYLFSSCRRVYNHDLIHILYTAPYFSGCIFARKYNETLSNAVYQYDIKGNIEFFNAWMKLDLPFQTGHYLFLSAGLFNKDKTFYGIAFEVLVNKAVSEDFELQKLGLILGKMISFEWAPVKRLADGLSGLINLSTRHNIALEKLLIAILSAVEKPVFNLKKLLELYYEVLRQNRTVSDKTVHGLLKEWEKENNLKKIIHQIKST